MNAPLAETNVPFGPLGLAFIGAYLASLLLIGWLGKRAQRENSLRDFYLGGAATGPAVLFLTLFATQYSGNTLFGFSGKAYRVGFSWLTCVHFMTAVIVGYLLFAPQLYQRSKRNGYLTPQDFLHDRFGSRGLDLLAPLVMIAALANYLLAQLTAMGRAVEGLTTLPAGTAFAVGVVLLAVIMLAYETLGGFRAVAWTDAIQGTVLILGIAGLVWVLFDRFGTLADATTKLVESPSETDHAKVHPPDARAVRQWVSYLVMFGLGASLYPQAVQRIYAAKSSDALRRSLALMAWMPLVTTLAAVTFGVIGAANLPPIEGTASDSVLTVLCREVQQQSLFGYWVVVVVFAATLAALMSTADSCLLTICSMATKDLYQRFLHPEASEQLLTRMGKALSWVIVAAMAGLAIRLNTLDTPPTLVKLLDLKFDMLVQLAPGFMLGIHWRGLRGGPVMAGMLAGLAVTFALFDNESAKAVGLHNGLYGLGVNLLVSVGGSWWLGSKYDTNRNA